MKNKDYWGDPRYFKLWEKMEMLGIKDISSPCQNKPIFRHIAGNYSLKDVRADDLGAIPIKELLKRTGKKPKLIPVEIERLEYLISYCLKNMYIKLANEAYNKMIKIKEIIGC
jgi:hypothetical protein